MGKTGIECFKRFQKAIDMRYYEIILLWRPDSSFHSQSIPVWIPFALRYMADHEMHALPDPHVLEDAKHTMALKAQNYDPIYPDPIWSYMIVDGILSEWEAWNHPESINIHLQRCDLWVMVPAWPMQRATCIAKA